MSLGRLLILAPLAAGATLASVSEASATIRSLKEVREEALVRQEWDTSCGAAALATVLTYSFNDPVAERDVVHGLLRQTEPLRVQYRGGFSLLDMKNFAEDRGYSGVAFRNLSIDHIRYMDAPIVPVSFHGYNHYVVFRGVTEDGRIALADPAFGNRTMSRARFQEGWIEGIAFVMLKGGE